MKTSVSAFGRYINIEGTTDVITGIEISDTPEYGDAVGEMAKAVVQLEAYATGDLRAFDLNLRPQGTDFQKSVWDVLLTIPYGDVMTYGQIAEKIGNPKAVRAVGGACHNNPIGIVIPCHRVLGKDGSLTGYAGGVHLKEMLLNHEKKGVKPFFIDPTIDVLPGSLWFYPFH
ncbi:MAG: methylated-DNA--[protein]-cysteine S-methyltransferase [Erysipelotrichales bacterium]|nr:MAG: methylated-DNA--[protein]-cysteine S-methyltransferase [Erysipelotrichales bacterium]